MSDFSGDGARSWHCDICGERGCIAEGTTCLCDRDEEEEEMEERSQEEIVNKIAEVKAEDCFGFKISSLVNYLDYGNAKAYLKEGTTQEEWDKAQLDASPEAVKAEMLDYMSFAWEKANGCRGISASRSMDHYSVWLWMLGDEMAEKFGDIENYQYYGKDNLIAICKEFGWNHSQWDDGVRVNTG